MAQQNCLRAIRLGVYGPAWSVFGYICPERGCECEEGSSSLRHFFKIVYTTDLCAPKLPNSSGGKGSKSFLPEGGTGQPMAVFTA